jgi:hypothetical protein
MKSTTCPRAKPGSRNSRSSRCVVAPPSSSENAITRLFGCGFSRYQNSQPTAIAAMIVKTQVAFSPMENAAPGL